jgi:hypothetical protein
VRAWCSAMLAIAALLVAPACSKESESASGPPIPCGDITCSGSEYCVATCTCCGTYSTSPHPPDTYSYACYALPSDCSPDALCECTALINASVSCSGATRTLSRACY